MNAKRITPMNERQVRKEMANICKRMHERGYIVSADGNVSVKLTEGRILMTPSGMSKGLLTPEDMILVDEKGKKISGRHNATSEVALHILAYEERPDIRAVVHAHPPLSTAFSVAGVSLAQCVLPEVILSLGTIPTTVYATPTTDACAESIRETVRSYDALILDRHGSVCVGNTLARAFDLLEQLEHTARITLAARQLGGVQHLPTDEVVRLQEMARGFGTTVPALQQGTAPIGVQNQASTPSSLMAAAPDPNNPCGTCNACNNPRPMTHSITSSPGTNPSTTSAVIPNPSADLTASLTDIITEEVQRALAEAS